jgi:hypothetical protein
MDEQRFRRIAREEGSRLFFWAVLAFLGVVGLLRLFS